MSVLGSCPLWFLKSVFHWDLAIRLDWLVSELQGAAYLHLPSATMPGLGNVTTAHLLPVAILTWTALLPAAYLWQPIYSLVHQLWSLHHQGVDLTDVHV